MNVYMYIYFTLFTEEQTAKVLLIVTMCLGMFGNIGVSTSDLYGHFKNGAQGQPS